MISVLLGLGNWIPQDEKILSKELLIGSWASCHDGNVYVELHFTEENDYAYHLDGDVLDYNVGKYIICSGKIHVSIQENDLNCEQQRVNQMEIEFITNDEFENVEMGKKYTFKRLAAKPIMDFRLGTKVLEQRGYMGEFNIRQETFNCMGIGEGVEGYGSCEGHY
jgi:hypothetical protein